MGLANIQFESVDLVIPKIFSLIVTLVSMSP